MPLRWQCPESVATRTYTAKSDVFSFGVCLWEIYAEGAVPYAGMTSEAAFHAVRAGQRLPRPAASSPEAVVGLIRECMVSQVQQRPSMAEVHSRLAQHMTSVGAAVLPSAQPVAYAKTIAWPTARGATVISATGDEEESAL